MVVVYSPPDCFDARLMPQGQNETMDWLVFEVGLAGLIVGLFVCLGSWIGFQLIHQNGRMLSHLEQPSYPSSASTSPGCSAASGQPASDL